VSVYSTEGMRKSNGPTTKLRSTSRSLRLPFPWCALNGKNWIGDKGGYGLHSFRRYRETQLQLSGNPQGVTDFWIGHGKKSISDLYMKVKNETAKRTELCVKAGLGFIVPQSMKVVKSNTKVEAA
jgi:hypothetical protein